MPRYVTLEAKQGGYWLRFDYDPNVVSDLKALPWWTRKWNPEMKAWWIHPNWIEDAKRVLNRTANHKDFMRWATADHADEEDVSDYDSFDDFVNGKKREPEPPPPPKEDLSGLNCFAKLYLLPSAPPEVAKAAYGALAKLNHPDTTSDPTEKLLRHHRMTEINGAWEQVQKINKARQ